MKGLYGCLLLVFFSFFGSTTFGQTDGDYRSRGTGGNWNLSTTWQVRDGGVWVDLESSATYQDVIPSDASGLIAIEANTTVDITDQIIADQITVQGGGRLDIETTGELIVLNGTADDLIIVPQSITFPGGIPTVVPAGTCNVLGTLENRGQVNNNFVGANLVVDGVYEHNINGGTIPSGTWNEGSSAKIIGAITGANIIGGLDQVFYDFVWSPSSQTGAAGLVSSTNPGLTTINHNLEILNTNAAGGHSVFFTTDRANTTIVKGDLIISGSSKLYLGYGLNTTMDVEGSVINSSTISSPSLVITGVATGAKLTVRQNLTISGNSDVNLAEANGGISTLELLGNLDFGSGLVQTSSTTTSSTVIFAKNSITPQTLSRNSVSPGGFQGRINYTVNVNSHTNLGEIPLTGTGNLNLNGKLGVGSTHVLGAVQSSGTAGNFQIPLANRNYGAAATIVYNGLNAQVIGDGFPEDVNLEIANPNGVTNNNVGVTNVVANLTLTSGALNIGSTNTINIQSNFITNGPSGGSIGGDATSSLIFSGNGSLGTLYFAPGKQILKDLTVARAGDVVLGSDLTVVGVIDLSFGNLDFSGRTLTVNGSGISSGSTGLKSSSSSDLVIGGSSFTGGIPFLGSNEINDLTFATTGGSAAYDWNASVKVLGDLFLNSGALTHNSGLMMGTNSTFRKGGGSFSNTSPTAETSYNVVYTGTGSTGLELPTSTTALNNLQILSTGTVTLTSNITVNGNVHLDGGTLAVGTGTGARTITMAGASKLWLKSAGSFSPGDGTVRISGSLTIQGTNPQFGNLTTLAGSSLTFISNNIQVSRNLTFDGGSTFTPDGGSITFNGGLGTTTQIITPGGKTFEDIIVNRTGTGAVSILPTLNLVGVLDIRSATNVQSNGNLVLISTSDSGTGDASILALPAGASVTGDVIVQRYMSGEGKIFRDISSPVQSATVQQIINSQIPVTGFPGAYPCAGCLNNNPSMFFYNEDVPSAQENGFVAMSSASQTLDPGRGYNVFVRETTTPRTISLRGPINSGAMPLDVTFTDSGHPDDGWNFVGNPYPSSIDWDESEGWDKVNIQGNMISVWDAGAGQYKEWNGATGSLGDGLIAKGQGFWVQTNRNLGLDPSLDIDEDAKISPNGAFYRKKSEKLNYVELILAGSGIEARTYVQQVEGSTAGFDNMDGMKFPFKGFSLASLVDKDKRLAINAVGEIITSGQIPLMVTYAPGGEYSFTVNTTGDFAGAVLSIYDNFTGVYNPIAPGEAYHFSINDSPGSKASDRFFLVFGDIVQEGSSPVSLYPNPVKDKVTVDVISETQPAGEVFNNVGKSVGYLSWTQSGPQKWQGEADFGSQPYGIYILRVSTNQGTQVVKFLKN